LNLLRPELPAIDQDRSTPVHASLRRLVGSLVALGLLAVAGPAPAAAQETRQAPQVSPVVPRTSGDLRVYAYTFRHKDAAEALPLIRPLLTQRGTVELQPGGNTLVVRDTLAALGRIQPALRAFDRPPRELRVEIMIVRAATEPQPTVGTEQLPEWLEDKLRGLLRWDHYTLLARSGLDTREDQAVTHEVGRLYGLSFRPGTVMSGERLKLHDFRIWRVPSLSDSSEEKPLLQATLNLWLGKPKVLGLANSESSDRALMVVLTCEEMDESGGGGG
jgi:hypothetical protein